MIVRSAEDNDIPAIVNLLRLSLGESLMPKSEEFWRWKHVANPFGKSPVLLAFENEQLIGVRAFMRWEWRQGDTIYKAVRAVDTATHPAHQGKGIFRKLTIALSDECKHQGVQFIFNTPNKKSKPGYIKMGWKEYGKLPVSIYPVFPGVKQKQANLQIVELSREIIDEHFEDQLNHKFVTTNLAPDFLKWRYVENPNVSYYVYSNSHNWIIYRLKPTKLGLEFRICEVFLNERGDIDQFWAKLRSLARGIGAIMITFSGHAIPITMLSLKIGPMITIRSLLAEGDPFNLEYWEPTLGDMEVF